MKKNKIVIAVHGGAGTILKKMMTPELEKKYKNGLSEALSAGFDTMQNGGSATDAVEMAVSSLENYPLFNAGRGSVFNHEGKHEMDASIMEGKSQRAGAVCCISSIKNPVQLARIVMEKSEHVMLCGRGAEKFARQQNIKFAPAKYFFTEERYLQWQQALNENKTRLDHWADEKKRGTVGAVALDAMGNLAAATSTGGMTNKQYGRIGDSPVVGAGVYANNKTCAVSCTGHGEFFLRALVAHDISCLMEYKNLSLKKSCHKVINQKLVKWGGEGGAIAVDKNGNIEMPFNTTGMYRGYKTNTAEKIFIYR